ncbi:hypothetical protein SOJ_27720 [Staphylococcus sp. OJ82]|nr:hypothetical protein SOJ_27720 [Staphylococcus sp. OJ82]
MNFFKFSIITIFLNILLWISFKLLTQNQIDKNDLTIENEFFDEIDITEEDDFPDEDD